MDKLEIQKQIDDIKNKSVRTIYDFNRLMKLQRMLEEGDYTNDENRRNTEED